MEKTNITIEKAEPQQEPTTATATTITIQNIKPSISPSIAEIERFISYLSDKLNLKPFNNLIVLIQKTEPQVKGYYNPSSWKHQEREQEPTNINEITLSSINLLFEPYETIAHEFAHFLNTHLDGYKGNSRNYHTLEFRERAEQLLLKVEKGNYGFNRTFETAEFKQMLLDFKPSPKAFKIFQPNDSRIVGIDGDGNPIDINGDIVKRKPKGNSRLLLFSCGCGCKVRTARNENKPLMAVCEYCDTEFKEVVKEPIKPTLTTSESLAFKHESEVKK